MKKKILAGILAVAVAFSSVGGTGEVFAANGGGQALNYQGIESSPQMENAISVNGTDSFGNLLMKELNRVADKQENNEGYNIFSIEMNGAIASVSFETMEDAVLVVGIYDEAGGTMLASGSMDVNAGETSASVAIDSGTIPTYFYVKGYLVEQDTLRPLCTVYECPNYTQQMQEFLGKTTADFAEEKVLNLDGVIDNNFAVYSDKTKIIEQTENVNVIVTVDDENSTYIIENADENITSLEEGDIFSYEYEDGTVLLVKVGAMTLNGTSVTITGIQTSMEEVFDYVKIDTQATTKDAQIDTSSLEEGVEYEGLMEEHDSSDMPALGAVEGEGKKEEHAFKMYEKKIGAENNVTLSGNVNLDIETSIKFYVSKSYQYVEFGLDYAAGVELSVSGSGNGEVSLAKFFFNPVAGVNITFTPSLVMETNANIVLKGELSGMVGFSVSNDEGIRNLTTSPEFKSELKGEVTVFVGLSLEPKLDIISESVLDAGMNVTAGGETKGVLLVNDEVSESKKHDCGQCIDGEIFGKCDLSIGVKIFNNEKLDFNHDWNHSVKIADFYYSFKYKEFAFTECPHMLYKITVTVVDGDGNPVKEVKIDDRYETDGNGIVSLYLSNGKHNLSVVKDGYKSTEKKVVVQDDTKKVTVRIEKISGQESNPGKTVKRISLGWRHTGVITEDGSLYVWGDNSDGQLGDGGKEEFRSEPIKIMDNVKEVSMGGEYSGAITEDGSLYIWGGNLQGQLGDGSTTSKTEPVKIMDNVKQVSLGYAHGGAITEDGSLYMWGDNSDGQLGDGTTTDRYRPVKVMENVIQISMGSLHSGAITEDGSLYMWGDNISGEIGDGSSEKKLKPTKIMDNMKMVSLGEFVSGAVAENGDMYMWGSNEFGELGYGHDEYIYSQYEPVKIMEGVEKICRGWKYYGAITEDGNLYMWGDNSYGQLGDGTTIDRYEPVKIMQNVKDVSLGAAYGGVIMKDGSLYMWGDNICGQLGNGTTTSTATPIKITVPNDSLPFTTSGNTTEESVPMLGAAILPMEASADGTISFTGLIPNEVYNFYAMKSRNAEFSLRGGNLFYITQVAADASGNLSISYQSGEDKAGAETFLVGWNKQNIADAVITAKDLTYNGKEQYVTTEVTYHGTRLIEGVDYELWGDYCAEDRGNYKVVVTGIGNYTGSASAGYQVLCNHKYADWTIDRKATCTAEGSKSHRCTICGEQKDVTIIPKIGHNYKSTITKATTKKDGKIVKQCTACKMTVTTVIAYPKEIKLSTEKYTYNGKAKKPSVTVKDRTGKILKKNTDYTITYSKGRKNVGKYTVTINFQGNYSGTVKKTFKIQPKGTTLSKVSAKKKGFVAKWKGQKKQTTGYQIQYATNSKFKKAKTVTVGKNHTTSKKITKLVANKKYYVRIRTYKKVKINEKSTKIYSNWSKVKKVKTKK